MSQMMRNEVTVDRDCLPIDWILFWYQDLKTHRVEIKKKEMDRKIFTTLFYFLFLIFNNTVQCPVIHHFKLKVITVFWDWSTWKKDRAGRTWSVIYFQLFTNWAYKWPSFLFITLVSVISTWKSKPEADGLTCVRWELLKYSTVHGLE